MLLAAHCGAARRHRIALGLAAACVLGAGAGAAVGQRLLSPFQVTSNSMAPAMARGDWLVVRNSEHPTLSRGDVALFKYPFGSSGRAVKRVIALPGDRVQVSRSGVRINGRLLATAGAPDAVRPHELLVPPGHVFVMGDNTRASWDSRGFGPVPRSELLGRVAVVVPDPGTVIAALAGILIAALVTVLVLRRRGKAASSSVSSR